MIPLNPFTAQSEAANFTLQAPFAGLANSAPSRRNPRFRRVAQPPISATILTKNSERLLGEVLDALAWCDEVIVLDTGSTDQTPTIAAAHANVRLHRLDGPFPGFGRAHRHAVALARNDWVLSVDSDEVISRELAEEIATLPLDPDTVYTIPFQNYFNGKHITTCGWAPDRHERLFNRTHTNFCTSEVHERVQTRGHPIAALRHPIRHYSYESLDDFLRKMSSYSQLFARQNAGRRNSGPGRAVARSLWAFFKSYLLERGIVQGHEGLAISAYKAQTVFWKYLMLQEANRRAEP
jgi:glycosyltransferase involved in cell wall biosynthesis